MGWLSKADERLRERFERLLLAVATRDLAAGWQLAATIGRPAAPLLWEMLLAEKANVPRRLALLVAAMLAGGGAEDDRLFAWLGQTAPMLEERSMAALMLALGPRRSRPVADFWPRMLGATKSPQQVLAIAVRLAAARFPGTEAGAPALIEDDPGLAAATAYAGLPVPPSIAARLWDLKNPARHADLFWRGALLGAVHRPVEGRPVPDALLQSAREIAGLIGDQHGPAHAAAGLLRVRRKDIRCQGAVPDWRLLQVLAADVATATELQPWLPAVPLPRVEEPQRLAVAYVLSRAPEVVVAERDAWGADARIRGHIAVALAWRLLGEERPPLVQAALPAVPEWFFVRWAAGAGTARDNRIEDPILETAAVLAAAQRLPRPAARDALEEALWRWGSHPMLGLVENERLLARDLLLVGSNHGLKYTHVRFEQRYRPAGIGPENVFFEIAIVAYDFLSRPRPPLPPEGRLR